MHWKDFKHVWFLLYIQMSALEWVLPGIGVLLWFFQWFDLVKLSSHLVHFNDFSPLCWILKTDVEKLLSHLVHLNAFSPVWFLSDFFLKVTWFWEAHTLCTCVSSLLSFQETRCGIAHITHWWGLYRNFLKTEGGRMWADSLPCQQQFSDPIFYPLPNFAKDDSGFKCCSFIFGTLFWYL